MSGRTVVTVRARSQPVHKTRQMSIVKTCRLSMARTCCTDASFSPTDIAGHRPPNQCQSHIAVAIDTTDLHPIRIEGATGTRGMRRAVLVARRRPEPGHAVLAESHSRLVPWCRERDTARPPRVLARLSVSGCTTRTRAPRHGGWRQFPVEIVGPHSHRGRTAFMDRTSCRQRRCAPVPP
jgi:hypothetical protein